MQIVIDYTNTILNQFKSAYFTCFCRLLPGKVPSLQWEGACTNINPNLLTMKGIYLPNYS